MSPTHESLVFGVGLVDVCVQKKMLWASVVL